MGQIEIRPVSTLIKNLLHATQLPLKKLWSGIELNNYYLYTRCPTVRRPPHVPGIAPGICTP